MLNMETTISKLFKETRLAMGKTQAEFAKLIRCSRVSLSMYETGNFNPGADKYERLLKLRERLIQKQMKTGQGSKP